MLGVVEAVYVFKNEKRDTESFDLSTKTRKN